MNKSEDVGIKENQNGNRYNNSKVYKLVNTVDDTFYIGSTCSSLAKRLWQHKANAKIEKSVLYSHFNRIGFENVKIVLIQEFNLQNKDQLRREEDKYIQQFKNDNNCLNSNRAFLSKEEVKEYKKLIYNNNRENILNESKEYYLKNKEKIKEYQLVNKDKIQERKTKPYVCICGAIIKISKIARFFN